jgi:hypothetical protein
MRRHLVILTLAGLAVLSGSTLAAPAVSEEKSTGAPATVAVQRVSFQIPAMRDEAAMVLVGTMLIGVAAAVRRAA